MRTDGFLPNRGRPEGGSQMAAPPGPATAQRRAASARVPPRPLNALGGLHDIHTYSEALFEPHPSLPTHLHNACPLGFPAPGLHRLHPRQVRAAVHCVRSRLCRRVGGWVCKAPPSPSPAAGLRPPDLHLHLPTDAATLCPACCSRLLLQDDPIDALDKALQSPLENIGGGGGMMVGGSCSSRGPDNFAQCCSDKIASGTCLADSSCRQANACTPPGELL